MDVKAWVLPTITDDIPRRPLHAHIKTQFEHLALADPLFDQCGPVDLLLGADAFSTVMDGKRIRVKDDLIAAFGSIYGWVLIGSIGSKKSLSIFRILTSLSPSLEELILKFWTIEEPELRHDVTENARCETFVVKNMHRG